MGEPGVGKSRLCAELFRYIDERTELIRWRQGRCLPYGEGITFWALGEIVKSHAGVFESDSRRSASAKLEQVLPDVEERDWLRARLLPLLGVDSGQSRRARNRSRPGGASSSRSPRTGLRSSSSRICTGRTRRSSSSCRTSPSGPRACRCCSCARPGRSCSRRTATWGAGTRNAHTINLSPLSENETSELVQGLLEQTVSEQVRQAILERVGGNPLYAEEFVRLVADRGLGETGDGLAFPESVQALIAARLDTLSPERKGLLQDAAVVGKVFWAGALAAMGERRRARSRARAPRTLAQGARPPGPSDLDGRRERVLVLARPRPRCRIRPDPEGRARPKARCRCGVARGEGRRAGGGPRGRPCLSLQEALELARAAGDVELATELLPDARRHARPRGRPGGGRSTRRRPTASTAGRSTLYEDGRPGAGAVAAQGGANSCRAVGESGGDRTPGARPTSTASAGDELGAAEALLDLTPLRGISRAATPRSVSTWRRRSGWWSAIRPDACSSLLLARQAGQ